MLWLSFFLGLGGFLALALAMDRHHRDLLGRVPAPARRRRLRGAGAGLLALSAGAAIQSHGWEFGPVWFVGLAAVSALLVLLLVSLSPAKARR